MLQFRDPCKKCLVRPSCSIRCPSKQKYYDDRRWKIGSIYALGLTILQTVSWVMVIYIFPLFLTNKFYLFFYVIWLCGIAIYIMFKYDIFNTEGPWENWMN